MCGQVCALQLKVKGSGLSINDSENTLDFTTGSNLSDYAYDNYQIRHAWKVGTNIFPHFHWKQKEDNVPNFLIQYRWQMQGEAATTDWTNHPCQTNVLNYTSGTLNQISHGGYVEPPLGAGLSDVLEIRVYRDNSNASGVFSGSDAYSQTLNISFIDIHIEEDSLGSDTQYTK